MKLIEALANTSMNPVTVVGPSTLPKNEIGKKYRWYGDRIQTRTKNENTWKNVATLKVDILCHGEVKDDEVL